MKSITTRKVKLLSGFILTTMISANAFALEIKNGKLLSHKERTTAPSSTEFLAKKNETLLNNSNQSESYVTLARLFTTSGTVGQPTKVESTQTVAFRNNSDGTQVYSIVRRLCVFTELKCQETEDKIQLDAGGEVWGGKSLTLEIVFKKPGNQTIAMQTYVFKRADDGEFHPRNASIYSGDISIAETKAGR